VHRGLPRRRPRVGQRRIAAATLIAVALGVGTLAGCKSKTPPVDSGPATTAAVAAAVVGDTTVPVATTLFEAPFYTVVAGDTIGKIANKLGVPAQKLIDANGISRPDKIQVGQKLRVPVGATGAAGATTTTAG
jgi:putative chitinase